MGQSGAATFTAQVLNEETHEQAMFMVDSASLLHYRDCGKQLVFAPDRQDPGLCVAIRHLLSRNAGLSLDVMKWGSGVCPDMANLLVRTIQQTHLDGSGV